MNSEVSRPSVPRLKDVGVTPPTIKSWLTILKRSLLQRQIGKNFDDMFPWYSAAEVFCNSGQDLALL